MINCAVRRSKMSLKRCKELEPLLAAQVTRHEVLFEAFVSAFMKFASDKVYCSGQSNMLYQPEFSRYQQAAGGDEGAWKTVRCFDSWPITRAMWRSRSAVTMS